MATNGCPVCAGLGRVLAFGAWLEPIGVPCPECAGLAITPASADELQTVEVVDQLAQPPVGGPVEVEGDPLLVEGILIGDL